MMKAANLLSVLLLTASPGHAGEEPDLLTPVETEPASLDIAQYIDASRIQASYTAGMGFDGRPGEVNYFNASLSSFLCAPTPLGENLTLFNYFTYGVSDVDVDPYTVRGQALAWDFDLLHRVSFPTALLYHESGSRWFHGLYLEPALRTDFNHVSGDDFFLSAALASAYQVNDRLVIGLGVYGSDLTNDPFLIAGPGFVWIPNDDWLVTYYGPRFLARRKLGANDTLALEIANHGGYWNVEQFGSSTKVDLRSWRAGLLYRHRLAGELWLEVGAGYTLGNKFTLSTPGGRDLFESDLDSAPYGFLALSMKRW